MKRILLTSAGFKNKTIEAQFLLMLERPASESRVLWIPTAAIDDDAKAVLPECMNDLLNAGIRSENITVYDLNYPMTYEELSQYQAIYVCGGSCRYLLDNMQEMKFIDLLHHYVEQDGVYVGVSAGSCICSQSFSDGIGWLPCNLAVHCEAGTAGGEIDLTKRDEIALTNRQAIVFYQNRIWILE